MLIFRYLKLVVSRLTSGSHLFAAICLLCPVTAMAQPNHAAPLVKQLARYTTSLLTPDAAQRNPLASTVQITLPRESVATVGDAVKYVLLRTGYRLADGQPAEVTELLALSLPEVHRQLGPYTVNEALAILLGPAFTLDVDAGRRVVAYRSAAVSAATGASGPPNGNPKATASKPDDLTVAAARSAVK
jgi:conjugative transfer region protein (TIGR03748 family)